MGDEDTLVITLDNTGYILKQLVSDWKFFHKGEAPSKIVFLRVDSYDSIPVEYVYLEGVVKEEQDADSGQQRADGDSGVAQAKRTSGSGGSKPKRAK